MRKMFIAVFLLPLSLAAHEDTIIERNGDILLGLPIKYQPATFNESDFTLSLGRLSVTFPKCVHELFVLKGEEKIIIDASWYHEPEADGLPPYITLRTSTDTSDFGKSLLINMDTLFPVDTGFTYGIDAQEKQCILKFKPTTKSGT
ncbi:hypothetical protein [Simiduia litorea]|uniref:hypothetical protein n=1 Tax=Simiduia litorea TaxID=1435348 RepID=UPI0036F32F51